MIRHLAVFLGWLTNETQAGGRPQRGLELDEKQKCGEQCLHEFTLLSRVLELKLMARSLRNLNSREVLPVPLS
jgi:hypothetical protein